MDFITEAMKEGNIEPITLEEAYAVYGVKPPVEIGIESSILKPEVAAKVYKEEE